MTKPVAPSVGSSSSPAAAIPPATSVKLASRPHSNATGNRLRISAHMTTSITT